MRHLLISVAALALTAGAALAQPNDPSQIRGKGGFGQYQQQQAERGGNGGPTTFTNQVTGQQPGPNGERPDRDRGNWQGRQSGPQQQAVAPQQQPDQNRGNGQGRGDRGNWQGRGSQQQQAVAPAAPLDQNRGNWQGRGDRDRNDRGNWQGRDDNRRDFGRDDNRRDWNRDRGGYRSGYNGPRRDFRNYSNYHRDWRPTRRFRAPAYHRPPGWYSARWTFGQILPSLFWGRDYWLDYRMYDLPAPPYGAVWVRVGDDALMIDDYSGEIITVAYNVFY